MRTSKDSAGGTWGGIVADLAVQVKIRNTPYKATGVDAFFLPKRNVIATNKVGPVINALEPRDCCFIDRALVDRNVAKRNLLKVSIALQLDQRFIIRN